MNIKLWVEAVKILKKQGYSLQEILEILKEIYNESDNCEVYYYGLITEYIYDLNEIENNKKIDVKKVIKELCETPLVPVNKNYFLSLIPSKEDEAYLNSPFYKQYENTEVFKYIGLFHSAITTKLKCIDIPDNMTDDFDLSWMSFPSLEMTKIDGSLYYVYKDKKVLFDAIPDENGDFVVPKDVVRICFPFLHNYNTVYIDGYFGHESNDPFISSNIKRIIINRKQNYLTSFNLYNNLIVDYVYDPFFTPSDRVDLEGAAYAGFIAMNIEPDFDLNSRILDYIKQCHFDFLHLPVLVEGALLRGLLTEEQIFSFLMECKTEIGRLMPVNPKRIQYSSRIKKFTKTIEVLEKYINDKGIKYCDYDYDYINSLLPNFMYPLAPNLVKPRFMVFDNYPQKCLRLAEYRKYFTYAKSFINDGDVFALKEEDKVNFYSVVNKKGNIQNGKVELKGLYSYKFVNYPELFSEVFPLIGESKDSIDKLVLTKDLIDNLDKKINYSLKDCFLEAEPQLGLFYQKIINDKIVVFDYVNNSRDIILSKYDFDQFEPYFCLNPSDNDNKDIYKDYNEFHYKVLRKVEDREVSLLNAIKVYLTSNKLITHSLMLKCAVTLPYKIINGVDEEYTNSEGRVYKIKDILLLLSYAVYNEENYNNKTNIKTFLSEFYTRNQENKLIGFSDEEIDYFLDKYFIFNRMTNYYVWYDSYIENDNQLIFYSSKWFRIFYRAVNKNKKIRKCSEIEPKGNNYKFFILYTIEESKVSFFIDLAKYVKTEGEFLKIIEKYLNKF